METRRSQLDHRDLRLILSRYHEVLVAFRDHLNYLNVYPVPDADTGTNMSLTMASVLEASEGAADMAELAAAMRRGALLGARGTSGVILSQLLGAIAGVVSDTDHIDGERLARALTSASDAAYAAVLRPVEGTILTVVREAAGAGSAAAGSGSALADVAESAREAGSTALERTPEMLPELKAAGVIDAGGLGFLLFLDTVLSVVVGRPLPDAPEVPDRRPPVAAAEPEHPRYEVVVRVIGESSRMGEFRRTWERLGNQSTVVVEGAGMWVCHIHTNEPGAALEAAREAGVVQHTEVVDLVAQITHLSGGPQVDGHTAVVAVAVGPGLHERFLQLGAAAVVAGGPSLNPSTAELLDAVSQTGAREVIILPNDPNVVAVAEQLPALTDVDVQVVPTESVAEGLMVMTVFAPGSSAALNSQSMAKILDRVVAGGVTRATRDARIATGVIREGAWLGMGPEGLEVVEASMEEASRALVDELLDAESAVLLVIEGAEARPEVTAALVDHILTARPWVSVEVVVGGQPHYPYLFGARQANTSR